MHYTSCMQPQSTHKNIITAIKSKGRERDRGTGKCERIFFSENYIATMQFTMSQTTATTTKISAV